MTPLNSMPPRMLWRPVAGRRHAVKIFAASLAGALVRLSAIAIAATPDRKIEFHNHALLGLIRKEFPPECGVLKLGPYAYWSETTFSIAGGSIQAGGYRTYWETNKRLVGGGMLLEADLGSWGPKRGFMRKYI